LLAPGLDVIETVFASTDDKGAHRVAHFRNWQGDDSIRHQAPTFTPVRPPGRPDRAWPAAAMTPGLWCWAAGWTNWCLHRLSRSMAALRRRAGAASTVP